VAASLLTVGFVANAIKVNQLLDSITSVESEISTVTRENERLRSELNRLQSVDDITRKADALGLMEPTVPPVSLSSDEETD
jgi:cell division protein FtsL